MIHRVQISRSEKGASQNPHTKMISTNLPWKGERTKNTKKHNEQEHKKHKIYPEVRSHHKRCPTSSLRRPQCNTPSNPWTSGTYSWQLSRTIYRPHRPTQLFCAHFVLTHAHQRKLSGRSPIPNCSKPSTLNLEVLSR
jgi:hypothetical protein